MLRVAPALAGLLLVATHAAADVTPRQVWDDWVASLDEGEAEITTDSMDDGGGRLTVQGLSVTDGTPEEGRYEVRVEKITLIQNDDGTVGVEVSPEYPIILTDTGEDGALRETRLSVRHPGLEMTISEGAGRRTHAFQAPEVRVSIEEVLEAGEALDLTGSAVLTDAEGRYDTGQAMDGESALSASQLQASFGGTDPEEGGTFKLTFTMEGLESENMLQLMGADAGAAVREMPEGASRRGVLTTSASSFSFETESEGETTRLAGAAGPGTSVVTLSAEGMTYSGRGESASLAISGDSIPLPQIAIDIGRTSSGFSMPVLAAEEPQLFAFSISLLDVVLDEGLWNMVDPAGILPRDPGTVVVDVSGEMLVQEDVGAAAVGEELAGEVEAVDINTVRVELAGSEALASGQLEMAEVAGEPRPVGEVEIALTGAKKLLERLVQAGILPREQATGMTMMLGMFTLPGAGADDLTSTIRLTEDGRIFVNDQQVR